MKYFIGCDLGLSGAISLLDENKKIVFCKPMPTINVVVGKAKKIRKQYDISAINVIIEKWESDIEISKAGFERLRAIPYQTSQTAFSMGGGAMLFKTLFTVHKIPFVEFEPRSWQKEIFGNLGIQYNKDTTKIASVQAAKQLFPGTNFRRTERCTKDDDGMTDSACIALYTKILDQ